MVGRFLLAMLERILKKITDRFISFGWCPHCKARVRLQWDPITGYVLPAHQREYPLKEILRHKISFCQAENYYGMVDKEDM